MTAVTENSQETTTQGNKRVIFANLDIQNTYTYVTGLQSITWWAATATTKDNEVIGGTVSDGTITFACNTLTGVLFKAEGY